MNIKEEIKSIANRFGLNIMGKAYEDYINENICDIINNIRNTDSVIGIKGAGLHTKELLSILDFEPEYIFDKNIDEVKCLTFGNKEFKVYPDSYIKSINLDIIIISSFTHRKEIKIELENEDAVIIDLYELLEQRGIYLTSQFYRNSSDMYDNVLYYRKKYYTNQNASNLKNLIVAYLKIYDILNYEKYSKLYIENEYEGWKQIEEALLKIESLLNDVKKQIKSRKNRDIVTIWNDQLGFSELKSSNSLLKYSKESLFFENAYTMTPFTVPTLTEMLFGLKSIDDNTYSMFGEKVLVSNSNNSKLICNVENAGYKFLYIGDEIDAVLFESKNTIVHNTYNSACLRLVDLLQILLDSKESVCCILHELVETHNPYLSGELDNAKWYEWPTFADESEEQALKQAEKSLVYWDKQLEFYLDFLHDNCIKIFMSDHGKRYNYQPIYKEGATHIIFFIQGKNVPIGSLDGMFSLYNYKDVIKKLLDEDFDFSDVMSDYVLMQEVSIYSPVAVEYYIKNGVEENSYSFRAVRTKEELYVKLISGKRYYFILPDEDTNHILEEKYSERIKELDILAGDKFIESDDYKAQLEVFRKRFTTHD